MKTKHKYDLRFWAVTAVFTKVSVVWDAAPCYLVNNNWCLLSTSTLLGLPTLKMEAVRSSRASVSTDSLGARNV